MEQVDLGRQQLAWAQEQDRLNRETLGRVLNVQLPAMEEQARAAREDRQRYERIYQPLEENLIREFEGYASPERMEREAGRSIADVNAAFDAQRRNALQRLEGFGVDPSQTRNAALDIGVRTAQAATQAQAAGQARERVENTGRALRGEAINIGRGYPGNVAQAYGQAVQAGQAGIGGANQTTATSTGALTSGQGFTGLGLQGIGQGANIRNMGYGNQLAAAQFGANQQQGMLSTLAGFGGFALGLKDGGMPARALDFDMHGEGSVNSGPSDGSGIDDQVDAKLSVGEYVIPADVVRIKGEEFFDKIVEKYHVPADQQEVNGMNNGGMLAQRMGALTGMTAPRTVRAAPQRALPHMNRMMQPVAGAAPHMNTMISSGRMALPVRAQAPQTALPRQPRPMTAY
jgi:hypothetical protein